MGLLGGTFDPVHLGHLGLAQAAMAALSLDRLVLMPARVPPHRAAPHASAAHRFAMTALAIQGQAGLEVSDLEVLNDGPSYTSRTLDRLEASGVDTRGVFFVTGADAFREIACWKGYPDVLDRCHFVVVSRPDWPVQRLRVSLPALADRMVDAPCPLPERPSIFLVDARTPAVSSTEVRRRLASGLPVDDLVPATVAGHIRRHRLYHAADARPGDDQGVS